MKELLQELRKSALEAMAGADSLEALESLRVKYLGKKGELTAILKQMGRLPADERPVIGQLANEIREQLDEAFESRCKSISQMLLEKRLKAETLDVTIPGTYVPIGKKHPLTTVLDEAIEIFVGMGFCIAEGPEVEFSDYNFTKLNTPEGHPARDRQDTLYFTDDGSVCLRTQTSPVQERVMETARRHTPVPQPGYGRMRWMPPIRPCSIRLRTCSGQGHNHRGPEDACLVQQLYGGHRTRFRPTIPLRALLQWTCSAECSGASCPRVQARAGWAPGSGHGSSQGAGRLRNRQHCLFRLCLRHRPGTHGHAQV